MRNSAPLLIWALILAIGAGAAEHAFRREDARAVRLSAPTAAQMLAAAEFGPARPSPVTQRRLALAARLGLTGPSPRPPSEAKRRLVAASEPLTTASIGPPDNAKRLLRTAMQRVPLIGLPRPSARGGGALAALDAATATYGALSLRTATATAYGELEADVFAPRRLTILQLGDSHTAADFFSGRVRERLQEVFGAGGDAYLVPGRPHVGVRSALFDSEATDGWSYEALQKSDARRRFYLSGFNAVSHRAGAELTMRSRGGRAYDHVEVAFLKQPGGGRAEVDMDGAPAGEINLDGAADQRATVTLTAADAGESHGFHEIAVKSLSDGPVTVTGVDVGREGDGVSYISLGFPGATVQLLQKLTVENIADDFRRLEPDVVVLAFGTNEGFNDNLDVAQYSQQYEQILRRLMDIRPGLRIVIIGPPDAARPNGVCHGAGVGQECGAAANAAAAEPGAAQCRFPVPPKLNQVREAQRKLAERLGLFFWDWSSAMPAPCGAQIWAAANPPLMARDYVHMTLDGYKQSADRFADYLIPLIEGRRTSAHVVSND